MTDASRVFGLTAIVPAAGIGSRMGADCPKQYLQLAGKTILEHTLARLLSHPAITQVIVALAPHDRWFEALPVAADPRIVRVEGGAERAFSLAMDRKVRTTGSVLGADCAVSLAMDQKVRNLLSLDHRSCRRVVHLRGVLGDEGWV